jgi:hypothetical protein
MNLTPENKAIIDAYSVEELLRHNRFAPIGDPWFQDETGDYWLRRLAQKRDEDNAAYVQASKRIGWDR